MIYIYFLYLKWTILKVTYIIIDAVSLYTYQHAYQIDFSFFLFSSFNGCSTVSPSRKWHSINPSGSSVSLSMFDEVESSSWRRFGARPEVDAPPIIDIADMFCWVSNRWSALYCFELSIFDILTNFQMISWIKYYIITFQYL